MLFLIIALSIIFIFSIFAAIDRDGSYVALGALIGGLVFLFGSLFSTQAINDTVVIETQNPVSVSVKSVNGEAAYVWNYNGRDYSVKVDEGGEDNDYRVFTKGSTDKVVTIEKYKGDNSITFFGPKSKDTIYRISTGALAK